MKHQYIFPILILILLFLVLVLGGYVYSRIDKQQIDSECNIHDSNLNELDNNTNALKLNDEFENCKKTELTFADSIFFVMTTVTTIGYGQEVPNTDSAKIFTILISCIGIPLNLMVVARLGDFYKHLIVRLLQPVQKRVDNKKYFVLIQACVALVVGKIIFLFIPAWIIMKAENWTYLDSFYFAFVTVTTIGFGDLIATSSTNLNTSMLIFYKICVYIWIYFGIAYIALLINLALDYLCVKVKTFEREIAEIFVEKIVTNHQYYLLNDHHHVNCKKPIIPDTTNKKVNLGRYLSRNESCFFDNIDINQSQTYNTEIGIEETEQSEYKIRINYDSQEILVQAGKCLVERVPTLRHETINGVISSLRNSIRSTKSTRLSRNNKVNV